MIPPVLRNRCRVGNERQLRASPIVFGPRTLVRTWGTRVDLSARERLEGKAGGIPHLAKNERDAPNFLYAALDRNACAALFKESRMKSREPTKLHRKSGMWGTRRRLRG
jgi:hypothetical protein